jgi:hypothetical protein
LRAEVETDEADHRRRENKNSQCRHPACIGEDGALSDNATRLVRAT